MFAAFPPIPAAATILFEIDGVDMFWPILWLVVLVAAFFIESATAEMVSIWFVPAAFTAMVLSFFFGPEVQFIVFIALSVLMIVLAKTVLRSVLKKKKEKPASGIEQLVGQQAVVVEAIDNRTETGVVKINGQLWTARTENPADTPAPGDHVEILSVAVSKLIVRPIK